MAGGSDKPKATEITEGGEMSVVGKVVAPVKPARRAPVVETVSRNPESTEPVQAAVVPEVIVYDEAPGTARGMRVTPGSRPVSLLGMDWG